MNGFGKSVMMTAALILTAGLFWPATGEAQLCKWEDEKGTVHYAERCPEDKETQNVKVDTRSEGPAGTAPFVAKTENTAIPTDLMPEPDPLEAGAKPREKSPVELQAACETARQQLLQPEREQLIRECISVGDKDVESCKRFYDNYGSGGRQGNRIVARKYNDIPECVAARAAGN